ncbi:M12 family metallopeptidase [Paraflavitalea pollutisoli]|uniref:M12 family metallopeptidase n=1 Tax=Paraflavitalea pollutisoli TaxID=3034143 RepID=UPI0023EC0C08|nr:M12 family metallopeptidase [Paraflavitalea sp. H1-2-19X]
MATKTSKPYKKPRKLCKQPPQKIRQFDASVRGERALFIISASTLWANGTEITYTFVEKGTPADLNVVRKAFKTWKAVGIGLSFREVNSVEEALVRIGFDHEDDSWSWVGREILDISKDEKTMNFGIDLSADAEGMSTALHEIGHTLGLQHEHQSPFAGIEWNEQAVYDQMALPPNKWDKKAVDENIIDKLPRNKLLGSDWDPKSIMQYAFEEGLIRRPPPFDKGINPPGLISATDKKGIRAFYPKLSATKSLKMILNQSVAIEAKSGEQVDFTFKAPITRKYTIQTIGELDTVMILSELVNGKREYLAGDDDSGLDKNAKIKQALVKGRNYIISIRVLYTPGSGQSSVMVTGS